MDGPSSQPPLADAETPRRQRNARLVLVLALVGLGAWTLHNFIIALIWALIIAIAIFPAYRRSLKRWPPGPHNILMPLVFTALVAVVFLLPFVVLAIQAAREAHDVLTFTTDAMRNGVPVPGFVHGLPFGAATVSAWWADNLAQPTGLADLTHRVSHGLLQTHSRAFGAAVTRRIVTFFFAIAGLFFILRDHEILVRDGLRASGKIFGPSGERIARQMAASVHGTVDGMVLVGLGEGVLLGIAFWIAGVPHPTLLGALAAVAAMIPFVIVAILALVTAILLAQGAVAAAVGVLAFGIVMNFVADHFVRPGLIGGATKLPFLWVLLGVLGGVESWGLVGLFIGPALMSALILLWRELVRPGPAPVAAAQGEPRTLSPVPIAGPLR